MSVLRGLCFALSISFVLQLSSAHAVDRDKVEFYSKPRTYSCVNRFTRYLKLNLEGRQGMTSPKVLKSILTHDMYLSDYGPVVDLLEDELARPRSLVPMVETVKEAVVKKNPLVNEFLCEALSEKLFPKNPNKTVVMRVLHHMYLLDKLVAELSQNAELTQGVNQHLMAKRKQFGVRDPFLLKFIDIYKKAGLFGAAKALTIDDAMEHYDHIRLGGSISSWDVLKRRFGLALNIMEATVTDFFCGFNPNACIGLKLAFHPAKGLEFSEDGNALEYDVSEEWARLYESWNLAFITGQLNNLDLLYPKLLIPQVIDADPKKYVYNRALALSLSIHFFLLRQLSGQPDVELENRTELSTKWGEINSKFGIVEPLPEQQEEFAL